MAIILHADMDAFYASVEQHDRPELCGRPVVVGGRGKRGVVAAASYEARSFGIRSAMPSSVARRLCPQACFIAPRMRRYAQVSARVREIFYRYSSVVEPLSLDEAYLDIGGSVGLFDSPEAIAEGIRYDVRSELQLPVSVGVGPGKLVAKIASRHAKPDGMLIVQAGDARDFLRRLPVAEIWGVGPTTEKKLHGLGVTTIGQLAGKDPAELERELGSWGTILHALASGDDLRNVECDRSRKSYGEENTFPEDATDPATVEATIIAHAETVAFRLRRVGLRGRTVTLKYRPSGPGAEFRLFTRSRTLADFTDDGRRIGETAMALWRAEPAHPPLRLVGVQVSGLDGKRPVQLDLFHAAQEERGRALNAALDEILTKFGPAAIRRGKS